MNDYTLFNIRKIIFFVVSSVRGLTRRLKANHEESSIDISVRKLRRIAPNFLFVSSLNEYSTVRYVFLENISHTISLLITCCHLFVKINKLVEFVDFVLSNFHYNLLNQNLV